MQSELLNLYFNCVLFLFVCLLVNVVHRMEHQKQPIDSVQEGKSKHDS